MIYRPVFTDIINECVRRRLLDLKHRSLNHYHTLDSYDSLFKRCNINRSIVYAWLLGIKKMGNRLWTDGDKLYSYEMMIGYTHNYEKVVKLYTAKNRTLPLTNHKHPLQHGLAIRGCHSITL